MIIYLKSNGYLPKVNDNHRHDIGKFMFAISVFWTYVWFSQYMLIWYTNFPEETLYFSKRLNGYPVLFYLTIVVNFILPFLVLIKRESKRAVTTTAVMAVIIIVGHWFDYFSVVVPELVPSGGFGLIGVGAFIMMGSVFTFTMLNALSKVKDLESSTHPFVRESYQHNI
jgi:cytochrome bd-type quinol oxidase subunit 2